MIFGCAIENPSRHIQEKLREAAKARIRRMVAVHKVKKGFNVPDFVKAEWQNSNQSVMAQMLMDSNWDKEGLFLNKRVL